MYKSISFYAAFGNRTGYQIHASGLCDALEKLIPVYRNQPGGEISISLLDTVTASQTKQFPPKPSVLLNVWEATEQPAGFIENLKNYTQLWVASEAQRAWSISQGVPEEFVFVVPEGIDPDIFKPLEGQTQSDTFDFLVCGQWQRRKSTLEIAQAFLKAFPDNPKVRLYLSVDTLFPSDPWKSTEERLEKNGIFDDRIIPVHFEERAEYVRRLQTCHVYVQCSRSEGFGRPGIEAMACGAVAILENYGGSTEFSDGALLVRVPQLEKPTGIYGDWQVPGMWGSPDYEDLVSKMKDAYENYGVHKEKALKTSEMIRTKFSWAAAAKKAYDIIQEIPEVPRETLHNVMPVTTTMTNITPEAEIIAFARSRGYEVKALEKRRAIFMVDCWPSSQEKMDTLAETIEQVHSLGYQVLVSSHYAIPPSIIEQADFYLYEKQDIMSGDDKPVYWRKKLDGTVEHKMCNREYQGVAALACLRNAIDFCRGKYDWIYQMSSDMEVDLPDWLAKVHAAEKPLVCMPYEGVKNGIGGGLLAGRIELLDQVIPYLTSWKQYAEMFPDVRFVVERWLYSYVASKCDPETNIEWITCSTVNRFDNVDRDIWKDEEFQCNFIGGPFLNIVGISNREYDVTFSNPIDGENYYQLRQKPGVWSRPNNKFFRDWTVTASLDGELKFQHKINLSGQNVLISLGSKALGDTIAWMPYIEEFRKKHGCTVYCSSWWNKIFDYPEIRFLKPGDAVDNVYASYDVGCYDNQNDKNPVNWRTVPLQKVAADILGLDYEPIMAKLKYEARKRGNGNEPNPYVCFSEFSTMQNKFWNRPGAWQVVINELCGLGYDCISVSAEKSQLEKIVSHNGQTIEQTIADISGAEFYVGLNHGPAWIAYALNVPVIMITGVSEPIVDMPTPYRVASDVCRPGCFSDPSIPIERGWDWCPRKRDYACTREITPEMVIECINRIRKEKGHAPQKREIKKGSQRKHKRNDALRLPAGPGGGGINAYGRAESER